MAVYFVYRCGYLGPTCLVRRRFDDDSVLDWFRRHWVGTLDVSEANVLRERALGIDAAYFDCVFLEIGRDGLAPPESMDDIVRAIVGGYTNAIHHEAHCLSVLTDDDEIDMAYYFFDDHFLSKHAGLASYLLHEDWRLPDGGGERGWSTAAKILMDEEFHVEEGGRIYWFWRDLHDGEHLGDSVDEDIVQCLDGVRVGTLCRALMSAAEGEVKEESGFYLNELLGALRSEDLGESDEERGFLLALRENPDDEVTWAVYSDWLGERGLRPPGYRLLERALTRIDAGTTGSDPSRNLVQVGEHVIVLHAYCGDEYRFDHWCLFDDLWGSANPELARALIRAGCRWDVLSTGDEERTG